MRFYRLLLLVWLSLLIQPAKAQILKQKVKIGLGFMGATYLGDLNPAPEQLHRFYPAGTLSLQFDSKRRLNPQLNLGFGSFAAQDREGRINQFSNQNYFVKTSYVFANAMLKFHFLKTKRTRPHLGAGVGFITFSPKDADNRSLTNDASSRAKGETYGTTAGIFPLNAGVSFQLTPMTALGLDYYYFLTTTDYLDNIGKLGQKSGNDALTGLQFSLCFLITTRERRGKD